MTDLHRTEQDTIGKIDVPSDRYWGAQTQRSLENFRYQEKMPNALIRSIAEIKLSAAVVNQRNGLITKEVADLIIKFAKKIAEGQYSDEFPLSVWQTGSGTQTNMNVNEVISNLACHEKGTPLGSKSPVHPNDHVNLGQSSNDTFPTAMHIAVVREIHNILIPGLQTLHKHLLEKSIQFKDIVKIGRTHMQDATPLFLGDEFSGYAKQIEKSIDRIKRSLDDLYELAQGGTAVGTGINTHATFAEEFAEEISKVTKLPFKSSQNKFESLATNDAITGLSGALNTIATSLMKIANDIRILGSGPRAGIGEISLPANEPGSSIMPGKVNPTQCESITMICSQVIGNHVSISIGNSNGHLELNVFRPMIAYNILQSIDLLGRGSIAFAEKCIAGIEACHSRINELVGKSLMLVTSLVPVIGYDKAAKIAKLAHEENLTLKEAALKLLSISEEDFDKNVIPEKMTRPTLKG